MYRSKGCFGKVCEGTELDPVAATRPSDWQGATPVGGEEGEGEGEEEEEQEESGDEEKHQQQQRYLIVCNDCSPTVYSYVSITTKKNIHDNCVGVCKVKQRGCIRLKVGGSCLVRRKGRQTRI
ncbi:hypothetical protein DM02DRAFT_439462 [Periconia macrospinosa]|uniref:Uncharacterized protein n=1 Tax=Periconia macrospinosa TaxID=97972 RepID=A0A2V1DMM2_9PLEO|nr:hypothetical protein DM02DRAFT_439462 [Periconia macrospinosa]